VDSDFLPSSVTDIPDSTTTTSELVVTAGTPPDIPEINVNAHSERSTSLASHPAVSETSTVAAPELTSLDSKGKATAVNFISPQ
jgi:hypothetical protein